MATKKLLIVESPAKAGTIKKYLGKDYTVVASMGHVIDLPKSQLAVDTENHFKPRYITIRGKGPLLASLKKEAAKADKVYLATYVCIIIYIIFAVILYCTKFGLRLRSCGENPQAADSLGINVFKMRYAGVMISGFLAGMGGFVYALTSANCSANGDVAGFGFLALAVMIFGNWKPLNIAFGALLFGFFKCISASYSTLDINMDGKFWLAEIPVSSYVYRLLPYVITLLVLVFTSKKSRAPKAEGIPYDKGQR